MPNRLALETSPYLRQHADNPVDWHCWGEEALALARQQNRPILLSIGYSSCHWCHVMAHESFEDATTAAVMNRHFVNIKVDREERPDLDHIYQAAHQMLTGRAGGWPLTLFLAPDGVPFYGGTYFPLAARHGLPGFVELLEGVGQAWAERRGEIESQNTRMQEALASLLPTQVALAVPDVAPVAAATRQLKHLFDPRWGGFGGAPKFPQAADLALLLADGAPEMREMALLTLDRMAEGGLFDQLGGGFFRYCVDAEWTIPHFEKMLYDNALLLALYADAWALTGDPFLVDVIERTIAWAEREMRLPGHAWAASLDADAAGHEGATYVWTRRELGELLPDDEYAVFAASFGLAGPANFEGRAWHLTRCARLPEAEVLQRACDKVLAARAKRAQPARDDKALVSWNALWAQALLRAGRRLGRAEWVREGQATLDRIRSSAWKNARLLALLPDGARHLPGYLDDYAFTLAACLESLQAGWRQVDYQWALALADALLQHFEDPERGGFFFTAHDHEALIHRPKLIHDNAIPAGAAIAAQALLDLWDLTGESRYQQSVERLLRLYSGELSTQPMACATLLGVLKATHQPPDWLQLTGPESERAAWLRAAQASWPPLRIYAPLPGEKDLPERLQKPQEEQVKGWPCKALGCSPAILELPLLDEWFASRKKAFNIEI